jgi:hypothetical protein
MIAHEQQLTKFVISCVPDNFFPGFRMRLDHRHGKQGKQKHETHVVQFEKFVGTEQKQAHRIVRVFGLDSQ